MRSVNLLTVENVRLLSCTAESPPPTPQDPPQLSRSVVVSTGLLRITSTEGREIAYLHLGAFSHPLMPRTRVWRKDGVLIFKQPTPGRYWVLELAFGKVDLILSRVCALSPKVDAPEVEEQQEEHKMSPLVRDAIETCSRRPRSVGSMTWSEGSERAGRERGERGEHSPPGSVSRMDLHLDDSSRFDDAEELETPLVTQHSSFLDSDEELQPPTGLGITTAPLPSRSSSKRTSSRSTPIAPRVSSRASSVSARTATPAPPQTPQAPQGPAGPARSESRSSRSSRSSKASYASHASHASHASLNLPHAPASGSPASRTSAKGSPPETPRGSSHDHDDQTPVRPASNLSELSPSRFESPETPTQAPKFAGFTEPPQPAVEPRSASKVAPKTAPNTIVASIPVPTTTSHTAQSPHSTIVGAALGSPLGTMARSLTLTSPIPSGSPESIPLKNDGLRILEAIMVGSHGKTSPSQETWSPLSPTHLGKNPVFIATPPLKFGEIFEFERSSERPSNDLDVFKHTGSPEDSPETFLDEDRERTPESGQWTFSRPPDSSAVLAYSTPPRGPRGPALDPKNLVKVGAGRAPILSVGAFLSWQITMAAAAKPS